jgi:UDP-N-acetylmuramate--alanine ligase
MRAWARATGWWPRPTRATAASCASIRRSPIVTNIDADHLENYGGDFAKVQAAFDEFLHHLPFYGLAVLCIDDAEVAALASNTTRHVMTYGFADHADVRAEDVTQHGPAMRYTLCLPDGTRTPVELALPGRHNVQNSLAAAAVAWQLGVDSDAIARALQKFAGIGRRFNLLAQLTTAKGATVQLVDDYGHHPKELEAVFAAARGGWPDRRLVVAFQPHRYSRTRDLFDEFAAVLSTVDTLVLTGNLSGWRSADRRRRCEVAGARDPHAWPHRSDRRQQCGELAGVLPDVLNDGDLLLMMGAGDIGHAAQQLAANGFAGETK